ncbi:pyruvate kinase [Pseudobacillus sp. FSL P4-0506]|uniref:pyruvate kinase n=1 Tax=Pseudobacillus sp. FSL P4-0506 TaxID=2921576 RepID=UPI0030F92254
MCDFSHDELVKLAWTLYEKAVNQAALAPFMHPRVLHPFSAQNLLAYLAYKNNIHSKFATALRNRGLCLSSEQYVIQSLRTLCSHLDSFPPPSPPSQEVHALSRERSEDVFGKRRYPNLPHVMVTLDSQMASPSAIKRFLLNGMSIARINCAYGEASAWKKVIDAIRCAEDQLRRKGEYEEKKCQIYMDLSGPKIRIGPLQKTTYPLKLGIKKDRFGRPLEKKKGLISWQPTTTKRLYDEEYDFILHTCPCEQFRYFSEGDFLYFIDLRNKRRKFLITEISPSGLVVSLEETAYIYENTKLSSTDGQIELLVTNLEKSPIQIKVKKGDFLKIYLNSEMEGFPVAGPIAACLSVSLPEAFASVREGDRIFIDDGKIQSVVREHNDEFIVAEILSPDMSLTIKENKGINLPDCKVHLTVPALTEKDEKDLAFICEHADIAGISFVHGPEDLRKLQELLQRYPKKELAVVAKIETKEAIHNFSSILLEGLTFSKFGIMIARGDLAIEIGFQQLPVVQEEILSLCRASHVPVILATQVLESLAKKGIPSRSELADLSFGSEFDCLMLNKGPFMKETLSFLTDALFVISQVKEQNEMITRPSPFTLHP